MLSEPTQTAPSVDEFPAPTELIPSDSETKILLICEHASGTLPPSWRWPTPDRYLSAAHWGVDIGIARFTRQLAERLKSPAVLAPTSRLLIDCNRTTESDTLFRGVADGSPIWLNQGLSPRERTSRIESVYREYHAAVDSMCERYTPELILSMHSYTPSYEGSPRAVQVGVLHDGEEALAKVWSDRLRALLPGYDVRINEPWSGIGGYVYSAVDHANRCDAVAMELELRNDLLTSSNAQELLEALAKLLQPYL